MQIKNAKYVFLNFYITNSIMYYIKYDKMYNKTSIHPILFYTSVYTVYKYLM